MRDALTRRRVLYALVVTVAVVLLLLALAAPPGAADTLSNIGPSSLVPAGGWMGRYPVSRYQLDEFFPAVSVSLLGGVDVSGLLPMVVFAAADLLWLITSSVANLVIVLFQFAFNLNLLTGEGGSGGALAPVAQAVHNIYASTFGQPWLIAAITAVGVWAMWKVFVQRRYAQTAGALLVSLAYCALALGIVARPAQTITPLAALSNEMSRAFLSITSNGTVSEGAAAESASSGQLFRTLIVNPWTVLEFGGLAHCADSQGKSVAVQPLSRDAAENTRLARRLEETSQVSAEGKLCINNREKYAAHFLAYPVQSPGRQAEYEAIKDGETGKLPSSDPAKGSDTYTLGKADQPAAQAAGKSGQYERLLVALLSFVAELGIWLLLGALAIGVILAQVLLLLLLAFAPVALIAAVIPGHGHAFFTGWIRRMLGLLARKAIYSLFLAILLAVCQALQGAASGLGWLMSFLIEAMFCWTVLLQRDRLTTALAGAITGDSTAGQQTGTGRLQSLYYATQLTRLLRSGNGSPPELPEKTPKPKADRKPVASGTGSTTSTSSVSRPGTVARSTGSSQQAQSTAAGAGGRPGQSTSTAERPLQPTPRPQPIDGSAAPARDRVDRAGDGRQRPAELTSTSRLPRPASATPTTRQTPAAAASTTSTSTPAGGNAGKATTSTGRRHRAATRSRTGPPPPQQPQREQRRGPMRPVTGPPATSTATGGAARSVSGTSTTTTPAPRHADRSKESK